MSESGFPIPTACWGTSRVQSLVSVDEHERCREIATKSAEAIEVSRA